MKARPKGNETETASHSVKSRGFWSDPAVWAVVALALLFRILYNVALHPDGHSYLSFVIDEAEYFGAAHTLAEGRGFSFFDTALWVRPPAYVLWLAGTLRFGGLSYLPLLLFQALLSAATLPALGWLAHTVRGRTAGRMALLLGALYLPFTLFSGLYLSETLFLFLFSWSLVALVHVKASLALASARQLAGWVCAAALLLGIAILTRATALLFLPIAAIWLAWPLGKRGSLRGISTAVLFLIVSLAVLVPWTVRNYAAYGRFVAIDSTSGYNLWLASVGVRDEERLREQLRPLANPAERQDYAYARALETIAGDPLAFARKGLKESLDLWRPNFGAEERQVRGYGLGRVPAWHLVSLLLLDDLLYIVILGLAVAGLILSAPHVLKSLSGLWVLQWVATAFIFFAVTRFRLPIFTMLIPWAGVGMDLMASLRWRGLLHAFKRGGRNGRIVFAAGIVCVLGLLSTVEAGQTIVGVARWTGQEPYRQGEALLRAGRVDEAISRYREAGNDNLDTRFGLAAAYLQKGNTADALRLIQQSDTAERFETFIIKGEAARRAGNLAEARALFNARVVQVAGDAALRWAWDHTTPPPTDRIEVGSGLDVGYVRGFYGPEVDASGLHFRWAGPHAQIRGIAAGSALIRWSGWRPSGLQDPVVTVNSSDGEIILVLPNLPAWRSDKVLVGDPGTTPLHVAALELSTSPFVGSGSDPRFLGVRIASVGNDK